MNDIPVAPQGLSTVAASDRLSAKSPNAPLGGQCRALPSIAGEIVREQMFLLLAADTLYMVFRDLWKGRIRIGRSRVASPP